MKRDGTRCFAMGNEAFTEGALAAGARFYGGYPITPSSEIAELSAKRMPQVGGIYIQMEDEISSMASIIGASAAGKKAYTATSGPGFSLMQENLGTAIMTETPCVVVNVQRNGPATGVATKPAQADLLQARYGTHGDHSIIAISPSSVQECYDYAITAFNLAEQYRTPVIFLLDGSVGHMYESYVQWKVTPDDIINRRQPNCKPEEYLPSDIKDGQEIPPMPPYGGEYIQRLTSSAHDAKGITCGTVENTELFVRYFMEKIEGHADEITITKEFMTEDAEYLIITFGCTTRAAREAAVSARKEGLRVGVLQLVTVWPFPEKAVRELGGKMKAVIVPEMNMGQMDGLVKQVLRGDVPVVGLHKSNTEEIKPSEILSSIKGAAK